MLTTGTQTIVDIVAGNAINRKGVKAELGASAVSVVGDDDEPNASSWRVELEGATTEFGALLSSEASQGRHPVAKTMTTHKMNRKLSDCLDKASLSGVSDAAALIRSPILLPVFAPYSCFDISCVLCSSVYEKKIPTLMMFGHG